MRHGFGYLLLALASAGISSAEVTRPAPIEHATSSSAVDLFEAIEAGHISAQLIPQDSTKGTVLITNTTGQPLTIKVPSAFAAVPVLAQRRGGGAGFGAAGGNVGGASGGSQALGSGISGGGGGGGGRGVGFFNIGPERVTKLKMVAVCLEHGKTEPSPRMAYELAPLSRVTDDSVVTELVRMLGRGEIDQRSAQAAAWHLANDLSWQQLAAKIGMKHIGGQTEPYFSTAQIEQA